ncbi:MAG TPA: glucoamylase family protein [Gemmatimonadaceae bacterium]|nr:glucoamylase family protein [Gemmatimonadaceae bacterium]
MATATPPKPARSRLIDFFRRGEKGPDRKLVAPIRGEVLGTERLARHARAIARKHKLLPAKKQRGSGPLLARLDDTRAVLAEIHDKLSEAAERGIDISPAGDWLLDNAYVVQEHIREIRTSLPRGYYQELPKLASGTLAEYPRVYDVAIELIAHTEGHLSWENVSLFVGEYQKVTPLRMGELWAIPTMFRLGLVENIRRMSLRVAARLTEVESADEWAKRVMAANDRSRDALTKELDTFIEHHPPFTPTFVARFLHQIRGYQVNFTPLVWLEQWIAEDGPSAELAVTRSNRMIALTQVTVSNCITSLRTIARLDWKEFVESQSATEKILRKDLSGQYPLMMFGTRDHYRHVVEHIAKRTKKPEEEIANAALGLSVTGQGRGDRRAHVGYYLIDEGRFELEKETGYTPPFRERIYRWTQRNPSGLYFGGIAASTTLLIAAVLGLAGEAAIGEQIAIVLLALIPMNEIGIGVVNQLVTLLVPPHTLPKLEFRETGIPAEYTTAVVVPTLFGSVKGVEEALEHIEVQYLANRDPNLFFAILSDFTDASTESRETDAPILEAAVKGINSLNRKYVQAGRDVFYLFHRRRQWNAQQGVWMGWERKRGKLGQFNRFLRGKAADAFSTIVGNVAVLRAVRYVITLDSDTVLPRDSAQVLTGMIAHPLNRAEYDAQLGRIVRGYGIFQPRVGVSLTSAHASHFAAIHSGHPGVDPYTTAVSDVYQDLFSEGSFTGKGIYDVDAFEKATHGRFPENTLLSHDLIEGAYSRAGLATDIQVFDDYPARYLTYTRRKHRWIRGDWQLLGWLRKNVPGPQGPTRNRLSAISRWKIFDNLRRSLVEIAQLVLLFAGWFLLPGSALKWTAIVLGAIVFPWAFSLLLAIVRPPRDQSWLAYYAAVARDAGISAQQFALAVTFLPHQAVVSADAIIRTLARLFISKRKLLEWQTASQVERAMASGSLIEVWRRMWPVMLISLAALSVIIGIEAGGEPFEPQHLMLWAATAPFILLWLASPAIANALSAPATPHEYSLSDAERQTSVRYAKVHWKYFETFATEETQWLAPDNFQEDPEPVVAARTSPTNIGLQLLSIVAAHDLSFIDRAEMIERLEHVFRSLERMRRFRGHFYNWYDLRDLHVLEPAYISTVDSGNLAGHLIALKQACVEKRRSPDCTPEEASRLQAIVERARAYVLEMDFKFLFDEKRKLFAIGFQQTSGTLDNSYYDLLASESHLASFIAIAKDDIPVDHWFRLGRGLTTAGGTRTLISWSGSMFEYLMPRLVLRTFPSTLLNQTHQGAVSRQISYGAERGIPWGLSESAYNVRDRALTYQYRAFGVPDLALKRGLSKDLVVAPYASALAMLVDPHKSLRNLSVLEGEGSLGPYGFRDAVDYTRPLPGSRRAVIGAYMAHHVGMSLVAFDNALNRNIWQKRFHTDPMVRSAELVLQERIPRRLVIQEIQHQDESVSVPGETEKPAVREFDTPHTPQPRVGILGNVPYTTVISNAGSGVSRFNGIVVNRWRNDGTRDDNGQWCYLKDIATGNVWSAGHQPVCAKATWYRVLFSSDRAIFHRRDDAIETQMEIAVVSDAAAEVRRITVFNRSSIPREIELTSYMEVVIAPIDADRGHPAFGNLFVQTEWLPQSAAILAMRRPRSAKDTPVWCGHVMAVRRGNAAPASCETDRAKFIGRGRSGRDPLAMEIDGELSGRVGAVLDPIFAIRTRVTIPPGGSAEVSFTTFMADDREQAVQLADLYHDSYSARRALDLSWAQAQAELREFGITPADAALYQELAGHLLFPHAGFKALPAQSAGNTLGQAELWGLGISGDVPILLATLNSLDGLPSVRQLLKVHHYWRLKGIGCDLVILNEHPATYLQELSDQLLSTVMASSESALLDRPGGVFIRRADLLKPEDITLLHAMARIQVDCDGLGLGNFLEFPSTEDQYDAEEAEEVSSSVDAAQASAARAAPRVAVAMANGGTSTPVNGDGLEYFNGTGGFNSSNEYEIRLTGRELPPAPWINVIANASGGFIASESGAGPTWSESSYFYRLTPWHNDPVRDRVGECIYLKDEDSGEVWSPTPAPIRQPSPYTIRHGAGYSIFDHEHNGVRTSLRVGVPTEDPVKIQVLSISNTSSSTRNLTMVSYLEWVLGAQREKTQSHIRTALDTANGVMVAKNFFDSEFADMAAFFAISEPLTGYTASRREFLGRNGTLAAPVGLPPHRLSGEIGDTVDPCGVLAAQITLNPGETREVVVLLGATRGSDAALQMASRYRQPDAANAALDLAAQSWRDRLGTITAKTPDPSFDLIVNQWALYQALSCRMWGRTALYQSSGAFGFRDQLQDVMAFAYTEPAIAREHILRSASRQFEEGDVQHWWHPHSGRGVRTRFSDDLVWLPFVVDHYVRLTGDTSVFDEKVPYLKMRPLNEGEDELYDLPQKSEMVESLFDHCNRVMKRACTTGEHGLPLIGSGDWNDGMNRVGIEGRGESVWLAWFLVTTMRKFAEHAEACGRSDVAADLRRGADAYNEAVERAAWDGEWYRRAYYDNGAPLGSSSSEECKIDSIAQSWSVISRGGIPERIEKAMASLNQHLVREDARLIMLLTPPFNRGAHDPGYIQGYLPGVRENGAQYTHAALWAVLATALSGNGDRAMELYQMINPVTHALTPDAVETYKVEPYVVAADVYTAEGHLGRGGWTWYTGSASWLYRVGLEAILGFNKRGETLQINPCIPSAWREFSLEYRHGTSVYSITVKNPDGAQSGVAVTSVDGAQIEGSIPLVDDGRRHDVTVTLASPALQAVR